VGGGGGDYNGAGRPIRLAASAAVAEHGAMADDFGPWSLWDFAEHHAGVKPRWVAGCRRYLTVDATTLGRRATMHVIRLVRRVPPPRDADKNEIADAHIRRLADRLRRAATARRDALVPRLKRKLMGEGYTITALVGGQRRAVTQDDLAVLDIDLADNALVGPGVRFDAVAITRVAAVERAPRGGAGGRPAEYDWEAFAIWLGATVYKDGFPKTKAQFLRKAQRWFVDTQGHEPSESVLKERLNRFYAACEFGRKP
jgi:hypothetical protein